MQKCLKVANNIWDRDIRVIRSKFPEKLWITVYTWNPQFSNNLKLKAVKHWKTFLENHQTNNLGYQKWGFSICKNKLFQKSTF